MIAPDRRIAAWLGFVHGALTGYAIDRVLTRILGEPDPRMIIASAHVGFYWRVALSLWWGALLSAFCTRFPTSATWLRRSLPYLIAGVTLALILCP